MTTDNAPARGWTTAWPDVLAFAVGLAVAWRAKWSAGDLVWSLWLSSFVVGYAMIVWTIFRPAVDVARGAWSHRNTVPDGVQRANPTSALVVGAIFLAGAIFLLAFFTFHFGMFHYVHSQFLVSFFPIETGPAGAHAGTSTYLEVLRRYWKFLPAAFLAERAAFAKQPSLLAPDLSVTAEAIARRKRANATKQSAILAPYRQVMRMHVLIFFFFFAHVARLENFAVYAVVYAVYFFPWRLLRRSTGEEPSGIEAPSATRAA